MRILAVQRIGHLDAALTGVPLTVHGDGGQTRDFTYVGTVTQVLTEAVLRGVTSDRPVNLAFGTRVSLLQLIELMESIIGTTLHREHAPTRAGDVRDSQADQSRLRALFPDVVPVPLEEGLQATIKWFQDASTAAVG